MKQARRKLIVSVCLLLTGTAEMFLLRRFPDVFFPGYRTFSRKWISLLARLTSFTRHSVWDVCLLLMTLLFLFFLVQAIRRRNGFLRLFSSTLLTVSLIIFCALQGWMGNHYAPKLAAEISLELRDHTKEELYDAAEYYLLKAAQYAGEISRDDNGHAQETDLDELAAAAGRSYLPLAETYPLFRGSALPVKRFTLIGEYLLYNGIIGMFMPVTGEASVPSHVPHVPMAFTMCHEAAHRLGIASEQEANFCAFLACAFSSDPRFLYSGYYSAFGYCYSSLYRTDREKAEELFQKYDDLAGVLLVKQDRQDTREAYRKYDSPLQDVSDRINDTYLKSFSHESGILSYGEVTDYLIAWFLAGN